MNEENIETIWLDYKARGLPEDLFSEGFSNAAESRLWPDFWIPNASWKSARPLTPAMW